MKKYLFFLSAIGLMLFTACSSEEDIATASGMTQEEMDAIIAEANQDSEVKIRLGLGSQSNSTSTTRAPLESENDGVFETPAGKYLGIFGLAQKPQGTVASPGPVAISSISWASTEDDEKLFHLMAFNQPARVKILDPEDADPTDDYLGNLQLNSKVSEIQFLNPNNLTGDQVIHYYPYGNWYNYYFYGYYPREDTYSATHDKVSVDYTINGTQDIIWAKAVPTTITSGATPESDVDRGFNAKYMRGKQNAGIQLVDFPKLELGHKLAQLRFYVKCSSVTYDTGGYGTEVGDKLFQIQNLKLTKVPDEWTLTIAEKNPSTAAATANEGKLARKANSSSAPDFTIRQMSPDPNNVGKFITSDENTFNQSSLSTTRVNIPYVTSPSGQGTLLGYSMIPTTAMMGNVSITGRQNATVPYLTFSIYYGATKTAQGDDGNGEVYDSEEMAIEVPEGGFLEGKVYNVVLNIPPPEEIHMHATLDVWEVVATPIDMTIE